MTHISIKKMVKNKKVKITLKKKKENKVVKMEKMEKKVKIKVSLIMKVILKMKK